MDCMEEGGGVVEGERERERGQTEKKERGVGLEQDGLHGGGGGVVEGEREREREREKRERGVGLEQDGWHGGGGGW